MTMHKIKKIGGGEIEVPVASSKEKSYYPSVHLHDVPLPEADVGDKIFIKIQGKIVGKSEDQYGNSVTVEMNHIGYEDNENEFTALSREDD